jgi:hypothetical protein
VAGADFNFSNSAFTDFAAASIAAMRVSRAAFAFCAADDFSVALCISVFN